MQINLSERVRGWLYIICSVGGLVVLYLGAKGVLGADEMALWTGFATFVATLARFNLGNSPRDTTPTNDAQVIRRQPVR